MRSSVNPTDIVADVGTYLQRKSIKIMRGVRRVLRLTDAALWGAGRAHITFMGVVVGCWICAAILISVDQSLQWLAHHFGVRF